MARARVTARARVRATVTVRRRMHLISEEGICMVVRLTLSLTLI